MRPPPRVREDRGVPYYRARYYDPSRSRFVSEDPIGFGDGLNVFAYVQNDPLNFDDPFGHAKGGKRKLNVNLPDGTTVTKRTPADQVKKVLDNAKRLGLSAAQIEDLRGLWKVIKRGGTMGILLGILIDVDDANAGEEDMLKRCREDPESCRPDWLKSKSAQ